MTGSSGWGGVEPVARTVDEKLGSLAEHSVVAGQTNYLQ